MNGIISLGVLLLLSGFFSGAEIALLSLSDFKIRYLREQKLKGSQSLEKIRKNKHRLLITILIGNNVVNIAASALATDLAIKHFDSNGLGIAIGIMTLFILIFGEITPKAFATSHASKIALWIAPLFEYIVILFFPLVKLFDFISIIVSKSMKSKGRPKITEDEISSIVQYGEEEGAIRSEEREMIQNILKVDDMDVKEIMTPRTEIVGVESHKDLKHAVELFAKHGFSRIPVYKKSIDNIIGVLYMKDIMSNVHKGQLSITLDKLVKPALFVPETKNVDALFRQFQKKQLQMAIIIDEYGGVSGLVTLEDLLEVIVGEIFDETEKIDPVMKKVNRNTWLVKGNIDIEDINEELGLTLTDEENFETLSGFILHKAGKIPAIGEQYTEGGTTYEVMELKKNRISLIKVVKREQNS